MPIGNDNIRIVHAIEEASLGEWEQWPSFHLGGSRLTTCAASPG
jgi:hypothetical protein